MAMAMAMAMAAAAVPVGGLGICGNPNLYISSHLSQYQSSASLTAAPLLPLSSASPSRQSSITSAVEEHHGSSDEAAKAEELWQQLFSDPSQRWETRLHKRKPEAPDFKHKTTKKALWINDKFNPSRLQERLATLTRRPSQKSEFSFSLSSSSSSSSSDYSSSSAGRVSSGQASRTKELWEEFFSNPSHHRSDDKKNSRLPDFKHKSAKKALWINDRFNPSWVHAKLAAMAQCQGQEKPSHAAPAISAKVTKLEQLWQEYFADPSQWWDNRFIRRSQNYPDFKHKRTHEGLWIENSLNPPWLKAKMMDMGMQSGVGSRSWKPNSCSIGGSVIKLCEEGRLKEALPMVEAMVRQSTPAPISAYASILKACARRKALMEGKRVQALIVQSGLESDIFIGNTVVDMYAKCGSVSDARKVFDAMLERNVFSWTAIISAYAGQGQLEEVMNLFQEMQQAGIAPDKVVFVVVLKVCAKAAALEEGKELHSLIIKRGFESDVFVGSALVDMYAKCKCIEDARRVFDNLHKRDVVSWSAMIGGYAQQGLGKDALALYEQMKHEGLKPDNVTYILLLKACASIADLQQGRELHSQIQKIGLDSDTVVGSVLIEMYAKCERIEHARRVFDNIHKHDVVSWNVMIGAYAQQGLGKEAFALYERMKKGDVQPKNVTYALLLNACASIAALEEGKQLHSDIIESGLELDVIVGSALVDMYAKSGCIERARQAFDQMQERNVVSWNAMIAGYAQQGLGKEAVALFEKMQKEGIMPNEITYITVLSACSHSGLLDEGRQLFESMCRDHLITPSVDHYACMVDLLGRAGCLDEAEDLINNMPIQADVVIWRTLLGAARNHGRVEIGSRAFNSIMKLEPHNASAYVLLSNTYAAAGSKDDEVEKIKEEMKIVATKDSFVQLDRS